MQSKEEGNLMLLTYESFLCVLAIGYRKVNVIKKKKEKVRCMFVCTGVSLLTYCESTFLLTDAQ